MKRALENADHKRTQAKEKVAIIKKSLEKAEEELQKADDERFGNIVEEDMVKFYENDGKLARGIWKVRGFFWDDEGDHYWVVDQSSASIYHHTGGPDDHRTLYYDRREIHKIYVVAKG